jgi:pyruvate dehydrogenase E1 component alpha subunit
MYAAARDAIDRARAGGGPTLIEAMTFRFHGHVFGDMDGYMGKGEKDAWMAKDPVPEFRAWLVQNGHADEAELSALEADIGRQLDEAVEFALSSAVPDVVELRRDVFAEELTA